MEVAATAGKIGSGAQTQRLRPVGKGTGGGYSTTELNRLVMIDQADFLVYGSVATDLNYLSDLYLLLRGEP
jgi:hypothetical protein